MLTTTVDFLRHGEVAGGSYYRGRLDDPLTELGWQQMHTAVASQHWDHIISSPLLRCQDFARLISSQTNIPFDIEANWQEISFGDWEGKTAEQINPDALIQFYQVPVNNTPINGESFSVFLSRIEQAWNRLLNAHRGKHILVLTHAGVIRCLFKLLLNLPVNNLFNLDVNHGGLTRFQCFHDNPDDFVKLLFHNLTAPTL